jgi:hypothetical protein
MRSKVDLYGAADFAWFRGKASIGAKGELAGSVSTDGDYDVTGNISDFEPRKRVRSHYLTPHPPPRPVKRVRSHCYENGF